MTNPSVEQGW
jgi:hypothetical protein